jgi:hypothetical protein
MASPFVLIGGSGVNLQGGRVRREWGVGHFIFFVFLFCFGDAVTSWTVQAHYTMPYIVLIKVLGGNLIPRKMLVFYAHRDVCQIKENLFYFYNKVLEGEWREQV